MKKPAVFFLLLLTALPCFARIGETLDQCTSRYGKPVAIVSEGCYLFRKSGFDIKIYFGATGAGRVEYSKTKTGNYITEALKSDEIMGILSLNSKTEMVATMAGVGVDGSWENEDKTTRAFLLQTTPRTLQIETVEFLKWEKDQTAKKAAAGMPGL